MSKIEESASDPNNNYIATNQGTLQPDHPLLQKAQESLKQQLLKTKLDLEEQQRQREIQLKEAEKQREYLGVQLYTFQQQLGELQIKTENKNLELNESNKIRITKEEEIKELEINLKKEKNEIEEKRKDTDESQRELDRAHLYKKQIEIYNKEIEAELSVKKGMTEAAELSIQRLEDEKKEQDYLIMEMQDKLRRQKNELKINEDRLVAQKKERKPAEVI